MGNLLIDVAIGLLLIYTALALLLTRLQEGWHGGLLRGRVQNMHRLLDEALGHDADLKKRLLKNPLLFALFNDDEATTGIMFWRRPKGPAAIPPDLFVKALLMELSPSGQLPSSEPLGPLAFMDTLLKAEKENTARAHYLRGLRGLVPRADSGWPAFETAIATWFQDIGDRAEGWYKRRSNLVGLTLAFLLCLVLNVDTHNIINTLGADSELREGLGRISELVLQQRANEAGQAPAAAAAPAPLSDPALEPSVRAVARLVDANAHISEAYFKDKAITRFGHYVSLVAEACVDVPRPPSAASAASATSALQNEGKFISNSDTWVSVLPGLLPPLEQAIHRIEERKDRGGELRKHYICLSHVSAWVRAASTASSNIETRRVMLEAGRALEDSKTALLSLLQSSEQQGGLRRLFRLDPDAFARCAGMARITSAGMQSCVLREQDLLARLPLGHTAANRRQQFCQVRLLEDPASPTSQPAPEAQRWSQGAWSALLCGERVMPALPKLGIPAMTLGFAPWNLLGWLTGLLVSTFFIALGAPILFDILGQWVKLRNAGRVREAAQSALAGGGTLSLPMLGLDPGTAPPKRSDGSAPKLPAVEGTQGVFEDQLTPREIKALKQRLGVQPIDDQFDDKLRQAILAATGAPALTLASYTLLMGRAPLQAGPTAGALPSSLAQLRQPLGLAPTLADNLCAKLDFQGRVPQTETRFSDELRALAVLYRFKSGSRLDSQAEVFSLATQNPTQLDQLDQARLNTMLGASPAVLPRFANAPWMDVALGELGQLELKGSSRATSNPRVCEYLDAVNGNLGASGDNTPWCAAFVCWVLKHAHATQPPTNAPVVVDGTVPASQGFVKLGNGFWFPAAVPEGAANWRRWSRPGTTAGSGVAAGGTPAVGDVVVVSTGAGKFHVGFVFELNTAAGRFWMLGGNQDGGTRVCLSPWLISSIA